MPILTLLLLSLASPSGAASPCTPDVVARHVSEIRPLLPGVGEAFYADRTTRLFFGAMPDSFPCFYAVFGDPEAPLHDEPDMAVIFPAFRATFYEATYVRKLVSLSVAATWHSGQVAALHDAAWAALSHSSLAFVRELSSLDEAGEASVWRFLFGGPQHDDRVLSGDLENRICTLSPRSCKLAGHEYNRAAVGRTKEP